MKQLYVLCRGVYLLAGAVHNDLYGGKYVSQSCKFAHPRELLPLNVCAIFQGSDARLVFDLSVAARGDYCCNGCHKQHTESEVHDCPLLCVDILNQGYRALSERVLEADF